MAGPELPFSRELHAQKYRSEGESFRERMNGLASGLAEDHEHYMEFREILLEMRFMPAGRVQASIGALTKVTPYNCFVMDTIQDNFVDGYGMGTFEQDGSIMASACEAARTMRMGGGVGYDFSTIRPAMDIIRGIRGTASGPVSFMNIHDAVCKATSSAGNRRGAQMAVLRIDHPDIERFIYAKQDEHSLTGFNISVGVTDRFMEHLISEKPFPLQFEGRVYREVDPLALWDKIMRSTWDWAEPGVLFIDRINEMNNLWYCETITATNPCGEQPLPPNGACLLGSFNLVKYLVKNPVNLGVVNNDNNYAGPYPLYSFDWDQLERDVAPVVTAMDNVPDVAEFPMLKQKAEARNKRRMGLGVTGLANAAEALGHGYGTQAFLDFEDEVLGFITRHAYRASAALAKMKGAFPMYDERYLDGKFIKSLDEDTRGMIKKHGVRNSHLTSIAPTGTISLCADNISSGIEPVFSYGFDRDVIMPDGKRTEYVEDYGKRVLDVEGKVAADVTVEEHIAVLKTAYRHVDSAVSKTCNVPGDVDWEHFKQIYVDAYEGGCKGCTTFRVDGMRGGVLREAPTEDSDMIGPDEEAEAASACYVDPQTGRQECE